jgi:hypothetical protein
MTGSVNPAERPADKKSRREVFEFINEGTFARNLIDYT